MSSRPLVRLVTWSMVLSQLAIGAPRAPAPAQPATRSWVVSGYLPSAPTKKVYVTITGKKIAALSPSAPAGATVIETGDLIFPGLVDMHSHIKYNVLPLWPLALGQFKNRFEWRQKFSPYKDAVSFNMKAIQGDTVCAAVRYAELKALTGGVTSIQGIGNDSKCAADFGVHNLEISGELDNPKGGIRGMADMVMPGLVGSVFEPMMGKAMRQSKLTYEQAYEQMLREQGVTAFVESFTRQPHSLPNGLRLLIGQDFGVSSSAEPKAAFASVKPRLTALLQAAPYELKGPAADRQLAAMELWLFGAEGKKGYFDVPHDGKNAEKQAYDFLSKGGVLTVSSSVRRYIGMFESGVRRSVLNFYRDPTRLTVIAHLCEGQRADDYNKTEYGYANAFGLVQDGLTVIHGVGMGPKDLAHAASKKVSLVWSPFSNLLLYGETLDVAAAKAAGVNIAIGADWAPTGSKHLLDELKIARRWLNKTRATTISDQDLVEMATINAAKALKRDAVIGRVAAGFQADLLLVKKASGNPYTALVNAQQADVNLVVVAGEPVYGESARLRDYAKAARDGVDVQPMPAGGDCRLDKSVRLPGLSKYDTQLSATSGAPQLRTVRGIVGELNAKMGAYAREVQARGKPREIRNLVQLDPIYSCADSRYARRFADFVERELDEDHAQRAHVRGDARLDDAWSPLRGTDEIEED